MKEQMNGRALPRVAAGGGAVAASALMVAGLLAVGVSGQGSSHGSAPTSRTHRMPRKAPVHSGRVTHPAVAAPVSRDGLVPAANVPAVRRPSVAATSHQVGPRPAASRASTAPPTPVTTAPVQAVEVAAASSWTSTLANQRLAAPIIAATSPGGTSLLLVAGDGGAFPLGPGSFHGSLSGNPLSTPIVATAADPATGGYWMVGRDGGVFAFDAPYHGSLSGYRLGAPVVAMAATPSGHGYWLASADGGVFAFGDAAYHGSLGHFHLGSPVVAMAATPSGRGYWLVSADGGVFAFGDATYRGSLSRSHLLTPVVAMATTPSGRGYWMLASDGGVFAFGDARYHGSSGGAWGNGTARALVPTSDGNGYWLVAWAGGVAAYGDAVAVQSPAARPALRPAAPARPVIRRPIATNLTHYPAGALGQDISQYQCRDIPPGGAGIAVVQVSGGSLVSAPNPCYTQEADWAGAHLTAYIYMNGLPSPAPAFSLAGPGGNCAVTNIACASYNYGFDQVRNWVAYSRSEGVSPQMWWLDVERSSGWQVPRSNQLVIQGALNALASMHVHSGIYSTRAQWDEITGGLAIPGQPIWVAGAGNLAGPGYTATSFCAAPGTVSFGGGRLAMVQYGYRGPFPGAWSPPASPYDLDLAC